MDEQSYDPIVPVKVGNRRGSVRSGHGTHWREGGNKRTYLPKETWTRLRTRTAMSTKLDRLSELAKEDPKRGFFSIAHLITPEALYAAFGSLRKDASAGMDGVTYKEYQQDAERNVQALYQRLREGKYQAH